MATLSALVLAFLLQSNTEPAAQSRPAEQLPFKVVYAGNAGTPYTAGYEKFLKNHFAEVKLVAGSAVRRADLAGFDILIIDGEVESKDSSGNLQLKSEKIQLTLDDLQGFPVVLMGGQGGFLSDELKLKLSWAHG